MFPEQYQYDYYKNKELCKEIIEGINFKISLRHCYNIKVTE